MHQRRGHTTEREVSVSGTRASGTRGTHHQQDRGQRRGHTTCVERRSDRSDRGHSTLPLKTPAPGASYPQNRCNAHCLQFFTACVTAGTHHCGTAVTAGTHHCICTSTEGTHHSHQRERTTKREVSAAGARGTHHLRRGRRRIAGTQRFTPEDARSNGFLPAESLQRSKPAVLRSPRQRRGPTAKGTASGIHHLPSARGSHHLAHELR